MKVFKEICPFFKKRISRFTRKWLILRSSFDLGFKISVLLRTMLPSTRQYIWGWNYEILRPILFSPTRDLYSRYFRGRSCYELPFVYATVRGNVEINAHFSNTRNAQFRSCWTALENRKQPAADFSSLRAHPIAKWLTS